MDRSETCTTYSICNVVVHYAFSNCYLFWGSKGVIREINTLKSASTSASKQTCTMFTMCKVVFFLSNIIYQYYWGTLVIQITLLKGYVLQSTSLQGRNGLLCNHSSFKNQWLLFPNRFSLHSRIGVLGIPVSSSTLVRGMRTAGFSFNLFTISKRCLPFD